MTIPLLDYSPKSQNHRVAAYEIPGDEQPRIYTGEKLFSPTDANELIWAAYRQIFNEQQIISSNRQKALESQLKNRQITVRDFIRALLLSDCFRWRNYEPNNNYRFVQMCVQRVLGRDVYHEREKIAWSMVLASKGLQEFVDDLLNSDEYLTNFGYDTVPYQRRRILPQRTLGELPFARMPRYGEEHRQKLEAMGYFAGMRDLLAPRWQWQKPPYPAGLILAGKIITFTGAGLLTLGVIATALAAWGIISL
ncbi:phycobilisome rod-core linker polypeptide [Aphanothece sacrum]|uniref:Phycobilisome rod-core linker polypeptide, phycocyanin-associated protein n=1 Tax=Aphanothece sacrum FPU1 TaxID=1920663 RepID=A0A401IK61_APHSA|nr:phycobilisome rod-core linker polypeptide [Aphanothece sacrum]GBF81649.1 phycobilisome rod-core linker polypeptide, phycocyanin-associated protein [Aphanothece sacrum FPU1]GBF84092.1 phycobilisome rod-core linker polypeptide [Aphanothece sacrum FPU3]